MIICVTVDGSVPARDNTPEGETSVDAEPRAVEDGDGGALLAMPEGETGDEGD